MTQTVRIDIAIGEDTLIPLRQLAADTVRLAADAAAGATSLSVRADHPAIDDEAKLLFGENIVVTLSAALAAGATTVSVEAIPGPLSRGDEGQLIEDISGWDIDMEVLQRGSDATPILEVQGIVTDGADGLYQVSIAAADFEDVEPGVYLATIWRRDSGQLRPLVNLQVHLAAEGFTS